MRMWNDSTRTLYYQVGIGAGNANTVSDHDIWRLPQEDDTYGGENPLFRFIRHRPVFRAGPPGSPVSPNLAGRDAAAFALCFQVFAAHPSRTRLALPAGGRAHLRTGEHRPAGQPAHGAAVRLLSGDRMARRPRARRDRARDSAVIGRRSFRPACRTPSRCYYLEQAARWASAYISHNGGEGEGLNLYDVSGLAHFELVRALREAGNPPGLARLRSAADRQPRPGARSGGRAVAPATPSASASRGTKRTPPRMATACP